MQAISWFNSGQSVKRPRKNLLEKIAQLADPQEIVRGNNKFFVASYPNLPQTAFSLQVVTTIMYRLISANYWPKRAIITHI